MNFTSKMQTLLRDPAMGSAYARWMAARTFLRRPPRLRLAGGAELGGWLSFSEYWSFRDIIPTPERLFVERCLSGGGAGVAFDVGANVGAFTCAMASLGAQVHAFEPVPETFCRLKNNVKSNGLLHRVQLNCLAVGREAGMVKFHIEEHSAATNRMARPDDVAAGAATSTQLVATVSLDDYCRHQGIERIDLLKLDVEGMEPLALQGARSFLQGRRIAALLVEICPVNLKGLGLAVNDLCREFEAVGYTPYELEPSGAVGERLSRAALSAMTLENVALLPDA